VANSTASSHIRRGELYWYDLGPPRGSVQGRRRPVCIVQNDLGNRASPTTIVAACTTQPRAQYPFHVHYTAAESGSGRDGIVLCEQLFTINQAALGERCGALPPRLLPDLDRALCRSLGIQL
jgi:mRNA interferase MazF